MKAVFVGNGITLGLLIVFSSISVLGATSEPASQPAGGGPRIDAKAPLLVSSFRAFAAASEPASQPAGGRPRIGDKPPLLQANKLLQAPPGAKLDAESLRGKVVVLEFWGTWCGACVTAIPHMNELAEKLQDQPVQFVAITYEEEAKVAPFLSKRPIKGWVALDTDKAMVATYGVQAWPHTVVLGRDGRIAAITFPTALQEQHLRDLVAGKKVSLPAPSLFALGEIPGRDPDEKSGAAPLFQVLVRPSTQPGASSVASQSALTARGFTVQEMLPMAFDCTLPRMLISTTLPEGKYDFIVKQPGGSTEKKSTLLQTALRSAFGVTGRRVTREADVFVLRVRERNAPGLVVSAGKGGMDSDRRGMTGVGSGMSIIAWALENQLRTPVVDETGLKDKYDFSVQWSKESTGPVDREAMFKALSEKLGLELVPAKRPIEIVLVEAAGAADSQPAAASR